MEILFRQQSDSGPPSTAAVIFDCDGTLCDTEGAYMESFNHAICSYKPEVTGLPDRAHWGASYAGKGYSVISPRAVEDFGLPCTAEELTAASKMRFAAMTSEKGSIKAFSGFDELFDAARSKGLRVAVASSSDGAGLHQKLQNGLFANAKSIGSLDDFDLVLSGDDVSKQKPDPEIYLLAAQKLNIDPRCCWVVEDTATGVLAGKRAGMRVAAVPNEFTNTHDFKGAGVDAICSTMADIVALL